MTTPERTGTAGGLARVLHGWGDDRLAGLLVARPDLARPAPHGMHALAARAVTPQSVGACSPALTLADLQAARAVVTGGAPTERLVDRALAWDEDGWVLAAPLAGVVARVDLGEPQPEPPAVPVLATSDDAAGLAAGQAITLVDEALWRIGNAPPRVLRAGGLPVADLRGLARSLDLDEPTAALLLETARGAGLLGTAGDDDAVWAPSGEYDEWRALPAAERWSALAAAWLDLRPAPHLVGTVQPGAKAVTNALAPDAVWAPMRTLRRQVLDELATLDAGTDPASLTSRLAWRHALVRVPDHAGVVAAVLREATWLGIVAGGLTAAGRLLLVGAPAEPALRLPARADRVLLGADLTIVVPGLLDGPVADLLRACADVESRGAATVLRITPASVERALDSGWSTSTLRSGLAQVAADLPQALDYLLDDAARRHTALTVGAVSSYLRCDDPAALADLAAVPRLALRVVAPTVAVSTLAPTVLVQRLRAAGRVPSVEGPDGEVHVIGATPLRSAARRRPTTTAALSHDAARALAAAIRGGETDLAQAREPETIRALLVEAADAGGRVRVDYVDQRGTPVVVDLAPTHVEAGRVRGSVEGAERVIPLPRITRVRT